mmetsp:Transcript_17438/g.48160  ORF Transcript_17438/g.48160 Transcript_17438/m.48160 type:complete len:230 (+) Transcript_17438:850-1539(+)
MRRRKTIDRPHRPLVFPPPPPLRLGRLRAPPPAAASAPAALTWTRPAAASRPGCGAGPPGAIGWRQNRLVPPRVSSWQRRRTGSRWSSRIRCSRWRPGPLAPRPGRPQKGWPGRSWRGDRRCRCLYHCRCRGTGGCGPQMTPIGSAAHRAPLHQCPVAGHGRSPIAGRSGARRQFRRYRYRYCYRYCYRYHNRSSSTLCHRPWLAFQRSECRGFPPGQIHSPRFPALET